MDPHVTPHTPALARGMSCSLCLGGGREIRDDPERYGQTERFIDTMMHVEAEGFIAICETCVGTLARLLDWIPPVEARSLYRDVALLTDERDMALAEVDSLNRKITAAVALGLTIPDTAEAITSTPEEPYDGEVAVESPAAVEEATPPPASPSPSTSDTPPSSPTAVRRSARKPAAK